MTALTAAACRQEVEALHDFFAAWFQGQLPATEANFARFAGAMHPDFHIIAPSGELTALPELAARLRTAHGRQPTIAIWTTNHRCHFQFGDQALVSYEEWQSNGATRTGRLSTALLQLDATAPAGIRWLHVHETWLPSQA